MYITNSTDKDRRSAIAELEDAQRTLKRDYISRNMANRTMAGHGIINDSLNKLSLPELHIIDQGDDNMVKKANFVGPFTNLERRLADFDPATCNHSGFITAPINSLDSAAYDHDIAYCKHSDVNSRHKADEILESRAKKIASDSAKPIIQRANAKLVEKIMAAKLATGQ